jgi:hypothetical protein
MERASPPPSILLIPPDQTATDPRSVPSAAFQRGPIPQWDFLKSEKIFDFSDSEQAYPRA